MKVTLYNSKYSDCFFCHACEKKHNNPLVAIYDTEAGELDLCKNCAKILAEKIIEVLGNEKKK